MIVHVFTVCRNEAVILPYFLRHYETFADRIFIFDQDSNDGTCAIAVACQKATLLPAGFTGLDEFLMNETYVSAYKKYSRGVADWAMCVDSDEFLYCENYDQALASAKVNGYGLLKTTGFEMVSRVFPTTSGQIYDEVKTGVRCDKYAKKVIFNPDLDVTFAYGRHRTFSAPDVIRKHVGFKLLHYRYLSEDYIHSRQAKNITGIKAITPENRFKAYPTKDDMLADMHRQADEWYQKLLAEMQVVI